MRRASGPEHFYAMHRHGFVRVATSTPRVRTGRRRLQPRRHPRGGAARRRREGRPRRLSRALRLLLRDRRPAPAGRAPRRGRGGGRPTSSPRAPSSAPVLLIGAPLRRDGPALQLRAGDRPRAAPRRRAEELPAQLPRILREALVRPRPRHRRADDPRSPARTVPFGTDLIFAAERPRRLRLPRRDLRGLLGAAAALDRRRRWPGATILANLSASNITIGKADERHLLCRSQSARAVAAYVYSAAGPGESTTDLAWDGQGVDLRARRPARRDPSASRLEPRALHRRRRHRPHPRPSGCACRPSTTMRRGRRPSRDARSAASRFEHRPTLRGHRPRSGRSAASPTCRTARRSSTRTATRPSTSRSRACAAASRRPAASTWSSASPAGSIRPTR